VLERSDPPDVVGHGAVRRDEEHLRRFLAARDRGDAGEMQRWWSELVIDVFDRMDGFVATAHRGRLDAEEHELAVQLSMARFARNLVETFEGVSMGQLVNATRTLARGICMDVQRSSVRARRHEGPSLDEGWQGGDEDRPAPAWEAGAAADRFERDERGAEVRDFLGWALPQVREQRRRVLELTFHGAAVPEIAAELAITEGNAHQLRSRGMKDLKRLKESYDA
jgi:DNA-directed RNA polymerase specialized sigma24 family protein